MKFQVGRFTCELSLNDRREVEATWLPWQPKYLSREERAQYRAGRAAFLERVPQGSIVDVVDRLSRSVSDAKTAAIPLVLPPLQTMALAQFIKRMDFETVARFSPVTIACDDGKSEADLVWLALIALRRALTEAASNRAQGSELLSHREMAEAMTKAPVEMEGKAPPRHPLQGALKDSMQVMPGTDFTKPASQSATYRQEAE
jgi:hypothetical protein